MSKARILVVDDEPAVLKVLVTRLQLAGYQVYSATNGEEALESFHKIPRLDSSRRYFQKWMDSQFAEELELNQWCQ